MKKIVLLLLLAAGFHSHAQFPYQAVIPGRVCAYSNGNTYLQLRIDSSQTGSVTSYYRNYKSLRNYNEKMYLDSPDWTGRYMIEHATMDIEFVSENGAYLIETNKGNGSKWVFKTLSGNTYIEAEVISQSLETFLGVTDSVRHIRLLARNSSGSIPHPLNNTELRLSKSYGLLDVINFNGLDKDSTVYHISGSSDIANSFYNLDFKRVFDIRPGDVRHIVKGSTFFSQALPGRMNSYELRTCIGRQDLNNGELIVISDSVKQAKMSYGFVNGQFTVFYSYRDTLISDSIHLSEYAFLNKLDRELSDSPVYADTYQYLDLRARTHIGFPPPTLLFSLPLRKIKTATDVSYTSGYWAKGIDDESYWHYIEGLGVYYVQYLIGGDTYFTLPMYYRRGSETGGDSSFWHLALSSRLPEAKLNFRMYPNPANELVSIQLFDRVMENARADIFSIDGRLVYSAPLYGNESTISTAALNSGCYFIQLTNGEKTSYTKLLKR